MTGRFVVLAFAIAACGRERDSGRGSSPPVDTIESGISDSRETGGVETGAPHTGETGGTDDTEDTGSPPSRICGVDGIPSDGAPEGMVSLEEAEAVYAGVGLFAAGDQDGDGCGDVVFSTVGGHFPAEDAGWTAIFPGPVLGLFEPSTDAVSTLLGAPDDNAMYPASGDVNGDGLADWLVGGHGIDGHLGGAYLVHGPVSGTVDLWTEADAILLGQSDGAGEPQTACADIDDDGYGDLLVGALNFSSDEVHYGGIYVQHGPVTGTFSLAAADAIIYAGTTWAAIRAHSAGGDTDGDGLPDITVGSAAYEGWSGGVWLLRAPLAGMVALDDADALLYGEGWSHAGYDVSSGGDVDGDGYGDLLVGAPDYQDMHGRAYLLHGPVSGAHSLGEADAIVWAPGGTAQVGHSVSLEQDMDSDGRADVAIGAPGAVGAPNQGAVFVFYEPFSGTVDAFDEAEAVLYSEEHEPGPFTGYRIGPAGDVNGDGYGDLWIGTLPDYLVFGGPR